MTTRLTRVLVASLALMWTGLAVAQRQGRHLHVPGGAGRHDDRPREAHGRELASRDHQHVRPPPLPEGRRGVDGARPPRRRVLAGHRRRQDLHVPDPQGHPLPRRQGADRRRRRLLLPADGRPEEGLLVALERRPDRRAGAGRRAADGGVHAEPAVRAVPVDPDPALRRQPRPGPRQQEAGDVRRRRGLRRGVSRGQRRRLGPLHEGIVGSRHHAGHEGLSGLLAGLEAQPDHPRDLPHRPGGGDHADAPPRRAGRHDRPVADAHHVRAAQEDAGHRGGRDAERPALSHRAEHPAGAALRHPRPPSARPRVRLQDGHRADLQGRGPGEGPPARTGSTATARRSRPTRRTSSRPSASWPTRASSPVSSPSTTGSRPGTSSAGRSACSSSRTSRRSGSN